jgi:hypothetical protein
MDLEIELVEELPGRIRLDLAPFKQAALDNPNSWVKLPFPERENYSLSKTFRRYGFLAAVRHGVVFVKARPDLHGKPAK